MIPLLVLLFETDIFFLQHHSSCGRYSKCRRYDANESTCQGPMCVLAFRRRITILHSYNSASYDTDSTE